MGKRTRDHLDSPDPSTTLDSLPTSSSLPLPSLSYSQLTSNRNVRFLPPPSALDPSPPSPPTINHLFSIPHSTSIHALAAPPCSSHIYTGGADGYIRRYALHATLNGTGVDNPRVVNLTSKPGGHERPPGTDLRQPVLSGYWENEEPGEWCEDLFGAGAGTGRGRNGGLYGVSEEKKARVRWGPKSSAVGPQSAVYSLTMQRDELWGLSGTSKGSINLFTVRHDEGQIRHVLRPSAASSKQGHAPKAAVSVLALDQRETGVLSGGWDGRILQWDLNTGTPTRAYNAHPGQISSISYRPIQPALSSSSATAKAEDGDEEMGEVGRQNERVRTDESANEDADADADGDADADADADGEADADAEGEEDDSLAAPTTSTSLTTAATTTSTAPLPLKPRPDPSSSLPLLGQSTPSALPEVSEDVFLSTSLDGTVLLWDRRAKEGKEGWVRRVVYGGGGEGGGGKKGDGRCAAACWSPSSHQFYVARRSPSIEIYDLRTTSSSTTSSSSSSSSSPAPGQPLHTLPLPPSTGALTALTALPNGRHLLSGSWDCVRLWDVEEAVRAASEGGGGLGGLGGGKKRFPRGATVVAGHHGGVVSALHVDPTCRWMFTASGNRGWEGSSTETVGISEIKWA